MTKNVKASSIWSVQQHTHRKAKAVVKGLVSRDAEYLVRRAQCVPEEQVTSVRNDASAGCSVI